MSVYNAPAGRRRRIVVAAILMVPGVFVAAPAGAADVPNIAAASDLQFVLQDIAAEFTRATGREVRIAFGSSGNFRRQIAEGAPFELFLSADAAYVDALARAEGKTWVYQGMQCLPPEERRCLVSLSDGGRDANYVREFDLRTRQFVEGGFSGLKYRPSHCGGISLQRSRA